MAREAKPILTLPGRHYPQGGRFSQKNKNTAFVWVASTLLVVAHNWIGFPLSVPTALVLALAGWRLGYWSDRLGEYRSEQELSLWGGRVMRRVDGAISSTIQMSRVEWVRIDEIDGRSDFIAVLGNGEQRRLLKDVLPDEVPAMTDRIERAFRPIPSTSEPLKVRVESAGTGYRSVDQWVTIEVPHRAFVGKPPSIFSPTRTAPRPTQRIRVREQLSVDRGSEQVELGRSSDATLRIRYGVDTADVCVVFADGEEALLIDRLDFQELAILRKALPASLTIE